jgi:two-component system cell cycle sensor histidine kinase/response regulator CckA
MNGIGVLNLLAGVLQLTIPSYALRLVRRFGAKRVGWFIVSAFSLLGLLHLLEPGVAVGISSRSLDIIYAVGSMLLLIGMAHVETLIAERFVATRKQQELHLNWERAANERVESLVEANQQLSQELARRRENERALADSEAQYRFLFMESPQPMWIIDLRSSRFLAVNKAALSQHGFEQDEFIERGIRGLISEVAATRLAQDLAKPCFGVECRGRWPFLRKDGTELEIELTVADVKFCECPARLVVARDVSSQKRQEIQFMVNSRSEAVTQIAGGVAQHFNNIFSVVHENAGVLLEKEVNPEFAAKLNQIITSAQRGASLTRQLQAIGGAQPVNLEPLHLNALLQQSTPLLRRLAGNSITLKQTHATTLPPVMGDARILESLLVSLVLNARDAMPNGGTLTIGTRTVRITEADSRQLPEAKAGQYACLSIHDTGHGITPEVQARIFEPFFTTKEAGKATGLGLSAVLGQVRQHQGWIECHSQIGAGTEFKVFLPGAPQSTRAVAAVAAPQASTPAARERILFLEPNERLRAVGRAALDRQGYVVCEADSAQLALMLWHSQSSRIDLLLTDILLPNGVSGTALAREMRKTKPGLKVLYTRASDDASQEGLPEGQQCLMKPYSADSLLEAIEDSVAA